MTADYLKNVPGEPPSKKFSLPGNFERCGGHQDIHVLSRALPDSTLIVDLGQWPPKCHTRNDEFAWRADHGTNGKWLLMSRVGAKQGHVTPVRGRVLIDLHKEPESIFDVVEKGSTIEVNDGFLVSGRVVLVPETDGLQAGTEVFARIQEGSEMQNAAGLPPHKVRKGRFSNARIARDVARLTDHKEVLLWDGNGFEWDGARFNITFLIGVTDGYEGLSAVAIKDDGFFS